MIDRQMTLAVFVERQAHYIQPPEGNILQWNKFKDAVLIVIAICDKQRVLMHRHQGLNVRHGLCHIYMRYLYIYELFIAFVCFVVCSLL